MSAAPETKSSALRTTLGTSIGLMSFSVSPALASMASDARSMLRIAE